MHVYYFHSSSADLRGINILQIDSSSCTLLNVSRFDTGFSSTAAADLVSYLQSVVNGTVLIGVTSNSSTGYLSAAAINVLTALGVSVGDVQQGGSFAFVAQVGYMQKTVMKKSVTYLGAAAILNVLLQGKLI